MRGRPSPGHVPPTQPWAVRERHGASPSLLPASHLHSRRSLMHGRAQLFAVGSCAPSAPPPKVAAIGARHATSIAEPQAGGPTEARSRIDALVVEVMQLGGGHGCQSQLAPLKHGGPSWPRDSREESSPWRPPRAHIPSGAGRERKPKLFEIARPVSPTGSAGSIAGSGALAEPSPRRLSSAPKHRSPNQTGCLDGCKRRILNAARPRVPCHPWASADKCGASWRASHHSQRTAGLKYRQTP